ncbi:MAG: hypothetical protein ACOC5T_07800 [Elusimicrobiota bacterium]
METYQTICFALSFLVFAIYFVWVWLTYGIQSSISNSFYIIWKRNPQSPNKRWWLTAALWGFSFPLAIVGVEIHPIFWLAAVLIILVGAAPAFKATKMQNDIHMIGAIGGISAAMIGFMIIGLWSVVIPTVVVMAYMAVYRIPHTTWWVETAAFLGTWAGLLVYSL